MNSGFKTQCVPSYRLLTEDQIKEIHRASLQVLETVGVRRHQPAWHGRREVLDQGEDRDRALARRIA